MQEERFRIGLKEELRYIWHDQSRLRNKLRNIKYEIKWAWQRAWRGYDDTEVWNFDTSFKTRSIRLLAELQNQHHGLFSVPDTCKYNIGTKDPNWTVAVLDEAQTALVLDTIIWHLKMSEDSFVERQLYGKLIYDMDYLNNTQRVEMHQRVRSIVNQNQHTAMKLMDEFLDMLWD